MRRDTKQRELFDQKATAEEFAACLERQCDWVAAVPDSVYRRILPALTMWHFASRENHAVGMAFGVRLGGKRPAILMQNSGLGLSIDALLGTFSLYKQGVLLVVSDRGVLPWEEIQHQEWGRITKPLLAATEIEAISFDTEGLAGLERAAKRAEKRKIVALVVERGNINE